MPYKGHVEKGVIVLDEVVDLEEGTTVAVEITGLPGTVAEPLPEPRYDRYCRFVGALDGMPEDWAEHHDTYLREEHGS